MVLKTVTVHKHALPVQVRRGAARHGMAWHGTADI
jgi:hypothetical protein